MTLKIIIAFIPVFLFLSGAKSGARSSVSKAGNAEPLILLDESDTIEKWGGVEIIDEYELVKRGEASAKWVNVTRADYTVKNSPGITDWSTWDTLSIWLYSAVANDSEFMLTLPSPSTANASAYFFHRFKVDWQGWTNIVLPFSKIRPMYPVKGWDNITSISFSTYGYGLITKPDTELIFDAVELLCLKGGTKSGGGGGQSAADTAPAAPVTKPAMPAFRYFSTADEKLKNSALSLSDEGLRRQMPGMGIDYKLAARVFPPEFVEGLRTNVTWRKFLYRSIPPNTAKWNSVPKDKWKELISDFAPVSCQGNSGNPATVGILPLTGKPFLTGSTDMSDDDFLNNPFQVKVKNTDFIIYEHEKDMPKDYPCRPNRSVQIPHLDGTMRTYRFFVPEAYSEAGPEFGSDRKNWFCPAGEVWRARCKIITWSVIPDCVADVVLNGNMESAKTLAAVLARLAEVYPGLPLYHGLRAHGFARSPDKSGYLTQKEYQAVLAKGSYLNVRSREDYPSWFVDIYDFAFSKLQWGNGGWTDQVMNDLGWLACAFDLIRDMPSTLSYSKAQYNDPGEWEKRVRKNLIKEVEAQALANPPTCGNTSYGYINGAVMVGIAAQNPEIFKKGLSIIELYLYNNWVSDGMAADASTSYAGMTQSGILGLDFLTKVFGGVELSERYGLKAVIDRVGISPFTTLRGITSKHADDHNRMYCGPGEPTPVVYSNFEGSLSLPFYGMTELRGGAPGRRTEVIITHQNVFQHGHADRLNIQLFYEGIELLPDFGYCQGFTDLDSHPWDKVTCGYELMGLPRDPNADRWGPWKFGYADGPEAHNVLVVDNYLHIFSPCSLNGYAGAVEASEPGGWMQFADTGAEGLFALRPSPVSVYRRQVTVLTLPGGASVVIDLFRVRGGKRHDLYQHVPADRPKMPGTGTTIDSTHWSAYRNITSIYEKITGLAINHYGRPGEQIRDLQRYELPKKIWLSEWLIQPSRILPKPEKYAAAYSGWRKTWNDVKLANWSWTGGAAADGEIVCGRGPWPGLYQVSDPETGKTYSSTLGLKDALDFRITTRTADSKELSSFYLNILEPRINNQASELIKATVTNTVMEKGGAVLCRLKLKSGKDGLNISTLGSIAALLDGVEVNGRAASFFPGENMLRLVDGSLFAADGCRLELNASWSSRLADVVGDLTGKPQESALIIESERPLPTNGTLVGQFVYVWHRANSFLQSVYTISRVSEAGTGKWRIDLADRPPFILQRAHLLWIDKENPVKMKQDFQFMPIQAQDQVQYRNNNVSGLRIRFLTSGHENSLELVNREAFTVTEEPPAGKLKKGEPFVVFAIQAGDRVEIPSFFACRASAAKVPAGQLLLDIQASGDFLLTLPGKYTKAMVSSGGKKTMLTVEVAAVGSMVKVPMTSLKDGKGVLTLGM